MAGDMIELAFAVEGRCVPPEHRRALADALVRVLPWLEEAGGAGVHPLNLVDAGGDDLLVSPRTRLVLRLPRARANAARSLDGTPLRLGPYVVRARRPRQRELLAHGTLYAPLVATGESDEARFVAQLRVQLGEMGIAAAPICGRWQSLEAGGLAGCSVMLSGLDTAQSLRVLQAGLGPHRLLGCGLFVPHRSAAAVGAPA